MAPALNRAALAAMIDHTLLHPEATAADVGRLAREAIDLGVFAVCVSPSLVAAAVAAVAGSPVAVASVVGFPSGAHATAVKAREAAGAVEAGAGELDMVIDLGSAAAGDWAAVGADIAGVRALAGAPVLLKVIVESGLWDDAALATACRAAEEAGADLVKTSTGFHPAGGATVHAVEAMAAAVGGRLGIKASGGIGSAADAAALVAAGATRLGMSRSGAVLAELAI